MKKVLFSVLFFVLALARVSAQEATLPVNEKTGKVTYMEVVEANGLTAKDLYTVLKDWSKAHGFKLKEEKEAEGELMYEASLPVEYSRVKGKNEMSNVTFTAHLMAKEGKYRFIFTDFVHTSHDKTLTGGKLELPNAACGQSGINAANWSQIKKKTNSDMQSKVEDLKKVVKASQNDPSKNKDW